MAGPLIVDVGKIKGKEKPYSIDLSKGHMLVAGSTGSGKSFFIKYIISQLIREKSSYQLELFLCDPKRVELSIFEEVPQAKGYYAETIHEIDYLVQMVTREMDRRFIEIKKLKIHSIADTKNFYPNIVFVVEEYGDIVFDSNKKSRERVQEKLARLAMMGRAAGITLIFATQLPVVTVISGCVKQNMSMRMAFRCATNVNSRVIIDCGGAERLGMREHILRTPYAEDLVYLDPIKIQPDYIKKSIEAAMSNERQCAQC